MTATTALTAQNTLGVEDIHYIPSEFVKKLIDVSVSDVGVDVVKTGDYFVLMIFIFRDNLGAWIKLLTIYNRHASIC
jgi:hydroxymethylpyrimidine/phosphomethylpyrimidine kinase